MPMERELGRLGMEPTAVVENEWQRGFHGYHRKTSRGREPARLSKKEKAAARKRRTRALRLAVGLLPSWRERGS